MKRALLTLGLVLAIPGCSCMQKDTAEKAPKVKKADSAMELKTPKKMKRGKELMDEPVSNHMMPMPSKAY